MGLALLLGAAPAAANDGEETEPGTVRDPADLLPKELKAAMAAMDKNDGAVRYARAMQRDGVLFLIAGGALIGLTVGIGAAEGLSNGQSQAGPFLIAMGVPLGLGVLAVGVPQAVLSNRLLAGYSVNGPVKTSMARLRLLSRWRLRNLRWMRDGAFVGAGLLGVSGLFSAVVWAVRDARGSNGAIGDPAAYRPLDALTSVGFLSAAGGLGVSGLFWAAELKTDLPDPPRVVATPTLSMTPTFAPGVHGGRPTGLTLRAGLVIGF
jgi:hypothetical protein